MKGMAHPSAPLALALVVLACAALGCVAEAGADDDDPEVFFARFDRDGSGRLDLAEYGRMYDDVEGAGSIRGRKRVGRRGRGLAVVLRGGGRFRGRGAVVRRVVACHGVHAAAAAGDRLLRLMPGDSRRWRGF